MHLYVKILKGNECEIAVSPSHRISEVKDILAMQISIPTEEQKLVFKGKTLVDDKRLCEYNITDGSKLFLVPQRGGSTTSTPCTPVKSPSSHFDTAESTAPLWDKLYQFLKRHFTPQDAEKVLNEFQKDFEKGLSSMSLDDIERLAQSKLLRNSSSGACSNNTMR